MDCNKLINFFKNDRFAQFIGVKIIEAKKGYCEAQLEIQEHHLNAANVVQGGAIFTLADTAFAVAANSQGQLALAVNINISFLQGEKTGVLTAIASETTTPKRMGAYDVMITNENKDLIARFNGLVYRKNEHIIF